MARREAVVPIEAEGRDKGKVFTIREMSAAQAEAWAIRAMLHLAKSGVDVPTDILSAGMAGIAVFGVKTLSGLRWEDAKPLLDEMMGCVKIIPDPSKPAFSRDLVGQDDIEEVLTLLKIRDEWINLHTGFSLAARLSGLMEAPAE